MYNVSTQLPQKCAQRLPHALIITGAAPSHAARKSLAGKRFPAIFVVTELASLYCSRTLDRPAGWAEGPMTFNDGYAAGSMAEGLLAALDLAEIVVRRLDGTILHWSRGTSDIYGWTSDEAVGQVSFDLLRTRFPAPQPEIEAELLRMGRWTGELGQFTQDGRHVTVLS